MMNVKVLHAGEGEDLLVLADNLTLKLTGEDTGGAFALFEQNNEPGAGVPEHVHDNEDEVFCVVEGEVLFEIGGRSVVAQAGSMLWAPRGIPHAYTVVGTQRAKAYVFAYPAGIEDMFRRLAEMPAGDPDLEKVAAICEAHGVHFSREAVAA
jgi:quercetin dioxygenase-like cupin family protein